MTVSDPGAGQQQGRKCTCGADLDCARATGEHASWCPGPYPTPPARDSGRDEAREAVVEAIMRVVWDEGLLDPERVNDPERQADCLRGSLLALPELAALLVRDPS